MSSPIHHPDDLDPALRYAPPRVRDQMPDAPPASAAPPVEWPWRREFDEPAESSEERAIMPMQMRRSLEPEWLPEPPLAVAEHHDWLRMIMRTAGLFGFAAAVAWVVVSIPGARRLSTDFIQASFSSATVATGIDVLTPAARTRTETPYSQDGTTVAVRNARHHGGTHELAAAPPSGGFGVAQSPPLPQAPPAQQTAATSAPLGRDTAPAPPARSTPDFVTRQIEHDEVSAMIERAEGFMKSGDLSSARLLLRRAAEAGNVYAAMTLAGTFDPTVRKSTGLREGVPDPAQARLWYERAERLGSTEAASRIQQLATATK